MESYVTVSYTHLDVYKRQVNANCNGYKIGNVRQPTMGGDK